MRVEGRSYSADAMPPIAEMRIATPGYFEAMGIPLVAGRMLERSDTDRRTGVVLVTESVVRKALASRPAIGARVAHGLAGVRGEKPWSSVVGVVGDVRGISLDREPMGAIYYAMINQARRRHGVARAIDGVRGPCDRAAFHTHRVGPSRARAARPRAPAGRDAHAVVGRGGCAERECGSR